MRDATPAARWAAFTGSAPSAAELMRFHRRHKCELLARRPATYERLGRIAAEAGARLGEALAEYGREFVKALSAPAATGRQVNVLQHLAGRLSDRLAPSERETLRDAIADVERGRLPLEVPARAIAEYATRHADAWMLEQTFLEPFLPSATGGGDRPAPG